MAKNLKRTPIAERIRYYRKKSNLTQQQIADMLGIKRSRYARYETGTKFSVETLMRLSEIFNISIDQLTKENVDYIKQLNTTTKKFTVRLTTSTQYNTNAYEDEYGDEEIAEITETEYELIKNFRNLPPDKQDEILDIINDK